MRIGFDRLRIWRSEMACPARASADAGKGNLSDEDLALKVVKQICDELGVEYKVVES